MAGGLTPAQMRRAALTDVVAANDHTRRIASLLRHPTVGHGAAELDAVDWHRICADLEDARLLLAGVLELARYAATATAQDDGR